MYMIKISSTWSSKFAYISKNLNFDSTADEKKKYISPFE